MTQVCRPHPICVPRVQSQVDEVIDVMQENISKVIERGERLDDLQDKSGESTQSRTARVTVSKSAGQRELKAAGNVHSFPSVLMLRFHWLLPDGPHMALGIVILGSGHLGIS